MSKGGKNFAYPNPLTGPHLSFRSASCNKQTPDPKIQHFYCPLLRKNSFPLTQGGRQPQNKNSQEFPTVNWPRDAGRIRSPTAPHPPPCPATIIIIEKVGGCNMSSQLSDIELSQSLFHPTPVLEQSLNGSWVSGIWSELATCNTGIQGPV